MNKLQEAKFKYYNDKKSLPVDANHYIKELEKSNAEMIKTLIRIRSELAPYIGSPTKDNPNVVGILVSLCDRKIEKARD